MKGRMPYPANVELMLLVVIGVAWGAFKIFGAWVWLVEKVFE